MNDKEQTKWREEVHIELLEKALDELKDSPYTIAISHLTEMTGIDPMTITREYKDIVEKGEEKRVEIMKAKILDLCKDSSGMNMVEMAKKFGVCYATFYSFVRKHFKGDESANKIWRENYKPKRIYKIKDRMTPEELNQKKELLFQKIAEGSFMKDTAEFIGINPASINHFLHKHVITNDELLNRYRDCWKKGYQQRLLSSAKHYRKYYKEAAQKKKQKVNA